MQTNHFQQWRCYFFISSPVHIYFPFALSSAKVDVNKELKEEESNPEGGEDTRAYSIFPSDKRREREKKKL